MDISSIVNRSVSQSFGGHTAQRTASAPVADAFKQAGSRIEQQPGATRVNLSADGKIKGALAEVQTAGAALSDTQKSATANDVKQAAATFVAAFNKASKAVSSAPQGEGKQAGAVAGDIPARSASIDLRRSVSESGSPSALKQIGVSQNPDGSLSVDAKALDKALQANLDQVRSALAGIGQRVEKTATRELADNGNVGASDSHDLEAQQSARHDQAAAAQRLTEQQTIQINNKVGGGLLTYQRTFSG